MESHPPCPGKPLQDSYYLPDPTLPSGTSAQWVFLWPNPEQDGCCYVADCVSPVNSTLTVASAQATVLAPRWGASHKASP